MKELLMGFFISQSFSKTKEVNIHKFSPIGDSEVIEKSLV